MGFNFPPSPIIGEVYPTPAIPGVPQYMWDGEVWGSSLDVVNPALFVMKSGDTMTGDLVLTKNAPQLVLDRSDTTTNASLVGKVGGIVTWSISFEDTLRLLRHDGVSTHAVMVGNWIDGKVSTTLPDKINLEGRWAVGFDGDGDDLYIERYDDDGVPLGRPITIERVTGLASVEADPVAALGIATKQYVDAIAIPTGGGFVTTDDVPPLSPVDGQMWWDSSAAQLYIFYADETSGQWVSASSVGPMGPQGPQGIQGEIGPQGPIGLTGADSVVPGPVGPVGPQGETGLTGETGAQGIQGEVGPIGPTGLQGPQGEVGETGPQGIQGEVGPVGATGEQGIQGETGATGPQGETGLTGATGAQGEQGEIGLTGETGPQGVQGEVGPTGPAGAQGEQGLQGVQGIQGEIGPQGPVGATGADSVVPGPTGPQGEIGPQGPIGLTGATGADSTVPGPVGPAGPQGIQGEQGPQGLPGVDGDDGSTFIGDAPPPAPEHGDFWWDSTAAQLFIFYGDGTSGQWVSASSVGPAGLTGPAGPEGPASTVAGPVGPAGPEGPAGPAGPIGETGPAGPAGDVSLAVMKAGDTMTGTLRVASDVYSYRPGALETGYFFPCSSAVQYYGFDGTSMIINGAPLHVASSMTSYGFNCHGNINGYALLCIRPDWPQGNYSCSAYINFQGGGIQYGLSMRATDDANPLAIAFNSAGNAVVGSISQNASSVAFNTASSGELKESLTAFDAGPIIDQIEVWHYTWKETGEPSYGVIAQQVQPIYPIAVTHIPPNVAMKEDDATSPEWWGVDYSKFVPLLLQEVKALRERVAVLEGAAARTSTDTNVSVGKKRKR